MKRIFSICGVLLLLAFVLCFPKEALSASREGLKLWLETLLPTLLPFLILTGFLLHTGGIEKIFSPFRSLWAKAFGLSPQGAYVLVLGLLCGYPMGAKLSADLYRYHKLGRREAQYLLTFCSNASPAFLSTYVAEVCLGGRTDIRKIAGILMLADMLCMLFFRFVVYRGHTMTEESFSASKKETSVGSSPGAIIDVSIMNGFETITRLGGYILLFSILAAGISHYWPFSPLGKYLLLGTAEITTGLHQLSASGLPYPVLELYAMAMTAFGGLCILAQTKSVLEGQLSVLPYAAAKCLNVCFTILLCLLL